MHFSAPVFLALACGVLADVSHIYPFGLLGLLIKDNTAYLLPVNGSGLALGLGHPTALVPPPRSHRNDVFLNQTAFVLQSDETLIMDAEGPRTQHVYVDTTTGSMKYTHHGSPPKKSVPLFKFTGDDSFLGLANYPDVVPFLCNDVHLYITWNFTNIDVSECQESQLFVSIDPEDSYGAWQYA